MNSPRVLVRMAVAALMLPSAALAASEDDRRFIQIFIEDAAVVENGWVEVQARWQNDVDNVGRDADFLRVGPVLAFSPIDQLEVGGRIDLVDIDLPGASESGLGDATLYGKWQFFHNPIQFTIGLELFVPTGDEEKLLGTGEIDAAVFAAVRKNLPDVHLTGHFGFRNNGDADLGGDLGPGFSLEGKTSIFLGGGALFPVSDRLGVSGELTVETERYEESDSIVQITAGGYWWVGQRFTLRGGIGIGLDDGAADVEAVVGAAWHF